MPFGVFDYQRVHTVHYRLGYASLETVTVSAVQLAAPMPSQEVIRVRRANTLPAKDRRIHTGHRELDRRYVVAADSPEVADRLLTPEIIDLIFQHDVESFIVEGRIAACCRTVRRAGRPDELEATLQQLLAIASRLPIGS